MNILTKWLTTLAIFFTCHVHATIDNSELLISKDVIVEALTKLADGDTIEAITTLEKIHPNDTSYSLSLMLQMSLFELKEDYQKVIEIADIGIDLQNEKEVDFIISKGNAFLSLEEYEKAKNTYLSGSNKYPLNHVLIFNIALADKFLENFDDYVAGLKRTINIYPFYELAHSELGYLAAVEGKTAKALMAYIMRILIDPSSEKALGILSYMNTIATTKVDEERLGYDFPEGTDDFSEIDLILNSYASLQKGYKVKSKFDIGLIRQLQVLFETLEYDKNDDGFWMQTYVKFYKKLWDQEKFSDFSYAIMAPSNIPAHQSKVKKNKKSIENFNAWASVELKKHFDKVPIKYNGELLTTGRLYDDGLIGIGEVKNGKEVGCWYYFHETGTLSGKGCLNSYGKADGIWEWYDETGNFIRRFNTKNGELNGEWYSEYSIGTKFQDANYKNGEKHGKYIEYYELGGKFADLNYKNGKLDGKNLYYFPNGQLKVEMTAKDDNLNGYLKQYYSDGSISQIAKYVDGERDSITVKYHDNGQISSTYSNKDGKLNGAFTDYYSDGTISATGKYVDGVLVGERKEFHRNGNLSEIERYNDDGLREGLNEEFDDEGNKYLEFDWKKNLIISYKAFDETGKVVYEGVRKGGDFKYTGIYPDGTIQAKGLYNSKGGKIGWWEFYDRYGVLESKSFYEKGIIDGTSYEYYPNGQIDEISSYKEGVWEGNNKSYYRNGNLWVVANTKDDVHEGPLYEYYTNGTLAESRYFRDDELDGWQSFYGANGDLERRELYYNTVSIMEVTYDKNGIGYDTLDYRDLNGETTLYHPDGNIRYKSNYIDGIRQGKTEWFYVNGQVDVSGEYLNNNRDGEWKGYFNDGTLAYKRTYNNGTRVGTWETYYSSGEKSEVYTYENGLLTGDNIYYNRNGTVSAKYNYEYGKIDGPASFYDPNGVLNHVKYYKNSKRVGYSYPDKNGELVDMISFNNGNVTVKSYFQNGNLGKSQTFKNGEIDGVSKLFFESGKIALETNYKDGYNQGKLIRYYESGQKRQEYNYEMDELQGKAYKYYENGQLKSEINYLNGYKHGTFIYYDETGKITKEEIWYNGTLETIKL